MILSPSHSLRYGRWQSLQKRLSEKFHGGGDFLFYLTFKSRLIICGQMGHIDSVKGLPGFVKHLVDSVCPAGPFHVPHAGPVGPCDIEGGLFG